MAPASVKAPNSGVPSESRRGEGDDRHRADDDEPDAKPEVQPLVADEARRDALVDHVALLEEELPGRDRRADETDDEQHHVAHLSGFRDLRNEEIVGDLSEWGMDDEVDRQEQQAAEHEKHREPLEATEIAGARRGDDEAGGDDDARDRVESEIVEREADADEFGDDRQRIEQKKVDDAESAPKPAEPLEDQPGVPDAGHRAEAQHHLLIDVKHRDQQRQRPQQGRAIGLTGLTVGGERARIVVAGHHDEAGAENGEQRGEAAPPGFPRGDVAVVDGAEGAADVADVGGVEHGGLNRLGDMNVHRHGFAPFAVAGSRGEPADDQSARVNAGAAAAFSLSFRKKEPAGCDRAAPTGHLGPSFKSVSSSGREWSRTRGAPPRAALKPSTPSAGRHPAVTFRADALEF